MAVKKSKDELFDKQDFNLFEAIEALDKKDYGYYDRLSPEQQKKFSPYMLLHYLSSVKGSSDLQSYYLQSVDHYANKHVFNELVSKHPKLQWLMLCASSPGIGKQFHPWIPQVRSKVSKLQDAAKQKEIKEYFSKVYKNVDDQTLTDISETFVQQHKRKLYLAKKFSTLKLDDIETLNDVITDQDIQRYEEESGN